MSINQAVLQRKKLLLSILSLTDGIEGRKKLQKIVYLANSMGWKVFNDFRFYLYGPYSDHLFYEIQNLKEADLITENEADRSYSYNISKNGANLLSILSAQENPLDTKTSKLIKNIKIYSAEELEIMASLYYLSKEFGTTDKNILIKELLKLKPHLDEQKILPNLKIFDIMIN